ncbi:hypothetical protein D3C87_1218810 [compost metagenome]
MLGAVLQADDQLFDLFGGLLGALGQAADFVGDHGKTTSGFTGAGCFDGGVERQQVGLLGHGLDDVEHAADLVAFALEFAHGLGGVTDFLGQAFDLGDGFTDHFVALTSLLVGGDGGFGGFFGVARNFLHGGGHFVHGSGDLIGLDLLAVDSGAGLLGDG